MIFDYLWTVKEFDFPIATANYKFQVYLPIQINYGSSLLTHSN